jgi:hypothetical protein
LGSPVIWEERSGTLPLELWEESSGGNSWA